MPNLRNHLSNIRFLFPYLKQHRVALVVASILTIIVSLSSLPLPLITKHLIDYSLVQQNYKDLIWMTALVLLISILLNIVAFYQQKLFVKTNQTIINQIKVNLLSHMLQVDVPIPSINGHGYMMSRIDDDTERIQALLVDNLLEALTSICTMIVGVIACLVISYQLFLLVLPITPIYYICFIRYYKKMNSTLEVTFEQRAFTVDQLNESLALRSVSRYYNDYRYAIEKYQHRLQQYLLHFLSYFHIRITSDLLLSILSAMIVATVLFLGGRQVINGTLTIGSLIAFNAFFGYITGPADSIVNLVLNAQKALLSLQRLVEILSTPLECEENRACKTVHINQIQLNHVTIEIEDIMILTDVNIEIIAGDRILIVGDSGSGKTTLLRVLAGVLKPKKGSIIINGNEISNQALADLRFSLGFVEQEPYLANDTIAVNIRLFDKNASREDVIKASRDAFVEPFVMEHTDGYEYCVGPNGERLSIGQKQRIALARALIRKPQILLLDEPTSNIDKESETCIFNTIRSLPSDTIVLMATHQPVPADLFNKILRIEKGSFVI